MMTSDSTIAHSASGTQLALQLMIEFIVILRPIQACMSGQCCSPPSTLRCRPKQQACPASYPRCHLLCNQ
ncbi:hypothetical protein X798_05177 [Onchocerca flexuosa]|uniref:Uncharacterized protein n=2 Tax=Onchocerca flexuosa TaxID=387005 RepID=A0A183HD53_9BILA|nr:hypothetical protein X798_05177 [Onchocerca flexuosa]VDO43057.1 unnamed protein product [Onchocerca flexuosa]